MGESRFNPGLFFRSVFFSYANKIILLVLGFLYILVVANLLEPSSFGVYSYLLDLAGTVLFLLGMESFSEVLRRFIPKTSSRSLVRTIVIAQFAIALVFAIAVFWFAEPLSQNLARGEAVPFEWLSAVILFLPLSTIVYSIAIGKRQFGKQVLLAIVENLSNLVLAIVLVAGFGTGLVGVFIARIVSLLLLGGAGLLWLNSGLQKETAPVPEVKAYAKQTWLTTLFKKTGQQANLIYMGIFVSASALGFFYLMQKISMYLIEVPANAINDALLPFASGAGDNKSFTESLISKSIKFYLILSIAMALLLLVAAPVLVSIFFPSFLKSLELVPLFALYYAMSFDYPMGTFFRVINQPRVLTYTFVVSALTSLVAGYLLISRFLVQGLLATMIVARVLSLAIFVFFIRKSGYRIEFLPRKKDAQYFWLLTNQVVRNIIEKTLKQKKPDKKT